MNPKLEDKVVVVTGASGGIGSAIARAFGAEGALVVLHYNKGGVRAARLQRELGVKRTLAVRADLTKESDVRQLFQAVRKRFRRADTLVANAGAWETQDITLPNMSLRQWRSTLDGVLTSAFLSAREFLKLVQRQQEGNIVFISSTAGIFGEAGHADYAAGKSALAAGLTRTLKNEISRIAPHRADYCGGRVNCICPGWTVVPRLAAKLSDHKAIRRVTSTMALPQLAIPDDIANAAVFLASDALARHITGQTIVIAGGMEGRLLWQNSEINPAIA